MIRAACGLLVFLLACGTGEKSLRTTEWQTLEQAPACVSFQHRPGEDAWGIHWDPRQPRLYLYHSDYLGDKKSAYTVHLDTRTVEELPYEVAYTYEFTKNLGKGVVPKLEDPTSPVEIQTKGDAAPGLTHFRWGYTRKDRPEWMWFHLDREAAFTGELMVKERATGITLICQRLVSAFPARPWEERLSLSPDGRFLVFIDGGVGTVNRIHLFELSRAQVVHPTARSPHT